jgi:hypothetical protein
LKKSDAKLKKGWHLALGGGVAGGFTEEVAGENILVISH